MSTANPYQAPNADVTNSSNEPYDPKIFTAQGRIGRVRYLAFGFISYLILIPVFLVIGLIAGIGGGFEGGAGAMSGLVMILGGIAYIALIVYAFILAKRRFNDLDQSGWLSLLLIIPLVNIIVSLFLLFAPGKPISNKYGQPPSKNPIWVWICGLLMPILLIGILAAVAIPAYQDYTERALQAESLYSE